MPPRSPQTVSFNLETMLTNMNAKVNDIHTGMAVLKNLVGEDNGHGKKTGMMGDIEDHNDRLKVIERNQAYTKGGLAVAAVSGISSPAWWPKLQAILAGWL